MKQTLDVRVSIPEEYVLVKKVEWEQMLEMQLVGKQWDMKKLEEVTGRRNNWLKKNVLFPYRNELDIKKGGFVRYPEVSGSPWKFGSKRMSEWLEKNLEKIM